MKDLTKFTEQELERMLDDLGILLDDYTEEYDGVEAELNLRRKGIVIAVNLRSGREYFNGDILSTVSGITRVKGRDGKQTYLINAENIKYLAPTKLKNKQ